MAKMRKKLSNQLKQNPRVQAVLILEKIRQNQAYSNLMIAHSGIQNEKDRRLLAEIVYGSISHRDYLLYQLAPFIKGKKVDDWVKTLLMSALFQLEFLDKIPEHAVINESVEVAKQLGNVGVGKFVNGLLRQIQRQGLSKEIVAPSAEERIAIKNSLPLWLTQFLTEQYGLDIVDELGQSLLEKSHVSARMTDIQGNRLALIDRLQEEGYQVRASEVSPFGIIGEKGFLAGSDAFKQGELTIQDESSMLVAEALDVQPDSHVLDACAAPGGKTTHLAAYLKEGSVEALDIHQHKIDLINENAKRLQVDSVVKTRLLDARKVDEAYLDESFDRILVDAPCSGLGLMRRKPDIKYSKDEQSLLNLPKIQLAILDACASKLTHGGKMVYSTCTINKKENEEVVKQFLATHPDYEIVPLPFEERLTKSVHQHMLTLLPQDYHTDGFFICCLSRK